MPVKERNDHRLIQKSAIGPLATAARPRGASPTERLSHHRTLIAAALGFIAGATCWHMIGFWSFIREAVLHTPAQSGSPLPVRRTVMLTKSQNRQPGSAEQVAPPPLLATCTAAMIDRTAADARLGPCDGPAVKLRPGRGAERADRGQFAPAVAPQLITAQPAAGGWATRIDMEAQSPATLASRD